jgi:RHS repeat-associated protein
MARASADGTSTDYMTFAGLSVTDLDHNGNPTDYIYTGGQKIAMISPADHRIHLTGITSQSGEELEVNWAVPSSFIAHTGDQVCWQQYNSNGGVGGLNLRFTDGQTAWRELANDGQQMNQNNTQGIWQSRCATFDDHANATLLNVSVLKDVNTPASSTRWDLLVSDVSITRLDGTIVQLFASGKSPGLSIQTADPNYDTGFTAQAEDVLASQDSVVSATNSIAHRTHFFVGDHLGTAQMEFAQGGYPVWQGQFAPFGDELNSQTTANHYKFTGKERDAESGLDYFGARYYASSMGRWSSADPSEEYFANPNNPQSLNLYAYGWNNPTRFVDDDGRFVNLGLAALGAGVGFTTGFLGSALSQYIADPNAPINWKTAGAYGVGGAVTGSLAGLTFGGSLLFTAAADIRVATVGNVAGGVLSRDLAGEDNTWDKAETDAAWGLGGGIVGEATAGLWRGFNATAAPKAPSPFGATNNLKRLAKLAAYKGAQEKIATQGSAIGAVTGALTSNVVGSIQGSMNQPMIDWSWVHPPCYSTSTNDTSNPNGQGSVEHSGCQ